MILITKQQFDIAYPKSPNQSKAQEIVDLLDLFEICTRCDVRRLYNDNDISSVFKIADTKNYVLPLKRTYTVSLD